jgi:hypothetical protein
MDVQQKDLSYYRLRLQEHLIQAFLKKPATTNLSTSVLRGLPMLTRVLSFGNAIEQCNEIANYILFEGLHFSRFDTIFQVVCNEFDTLMADEELRPFALKMFRVCEPVLPNIN